MLNRPGIAENSEGIGGPRAIQFFGVGFQDSHKYVEEFGPGTGEPRPMVAVVIDEPERRPLLKRLITRFPEDLGDPEVRPFVLASSEELPRDRNQDDQPYSSHRHCLPRAGFEVLPPRERQQPPGKKTREEDDEQLREDRDPYIAA